MFYMENESREITRLANVGNLISQLDLHCCITLIILTSMPTRSNKSQEVDCRTQMKQKSPLHDILSGKLLEFWSHWTLAPRE